MFDGKLDKMTRKRHTVYKGKKRKEIVKESWDRERQYEVVPTCNNSHQGLSSKRKRRKRMIKSSVQYQCSSRKDDDPQHTDIRIKESEACYYKDHSKDRDRVQGSEMRSRHRHRDHHNFLSKHRGKGEQMRLFDEKGNHGRRHKKRGKNCSVMHYSVDITPGNDEFGVEHKKIKIQQDSMDNLVHSEEETYCNSDNSGSDFSNISSPFLERQVGLLLPLSVHANRGL